MAANPNVPIDWGRRKARFLAYMKAFNPTASPLEPLESGFVAADLHDSIFEEIAQRAEIEPGSQQVVLGGIGSGKTTELLLTQKHLQARELQAIYMEASRYTDLAAAEPGSLVAMLGLELIELTKGNETVRLAAQEMRNYANGRWVQTGDLLSSALLSAATFVPGKLRSPVPPAIQPIWSRLKELIQAARSQGELVALFDGLDRLPTGNRFWEVASTDLTALRELEVAVVTVAPWAMLYEPNRPLGERFDRVHELKAETYDNLQLKLRAILLKRDTMKLLDPNNSAEICEASGGIIRDLISLARDAGAEAYVADAEVIGETEIQSAVRILGQSYQRGLSPSQVETLRNWKERESFDPKRPEILELLMTRRVLQRSADRFRVHPALASVLK